MRSEQVDALGEVLVGGGREIKNPSFENEAETGYEEKSGERRRTNMCVCFFSSEVWARYEFFFSFETTTLTQAASVQKSRGRFTPHPVRRQQKRASLPVWTRLPHVAQEKVGAMRSTTAIRASRSIAPCPARFAGAHPASRRVGWPTAEALDFFREHFARSQVVDDSFTRVTL